MICTSCGVSNPAGAKFCNECAKPLPIGCAKCGAPNSPKAKFCSECAAPLTSPSTPAPAAADAPSAALTIAPDADRTEAPDGERKTITMLFADIKGSMELMEDLDPEEARRLIDPALTLMIEAAHRYDGYIVQSTGDGIFALFGAPVAHEDHPHRALYAALRIQDEMRRYSARLREAGNLPIEARVGINTGEVVVREIRTAEAHVEYTPIGHSTSLAARMQALAPTGSIAVTDQTRRLCEGYFSFKSLGPTRVKGVSDPIEVYEVTGLGSLRTRLQMSVQRGLSKFVGRQAEIEAMKRSLDQARAGHGQIVAAVGEAGVGKSRLFHEFKAIAQSRSLLLETFSVSHGKASAYLPLVELLKGYFEIDAADDERKRREKVTGKVLALDRRLEDILPYLFSLLAITEPGAAVMIGADPQTIRRRTFDGIKRLLLRESLNQPLIIIFEDLHWLDPESQAFLDSLSESIATARILLLVNYRPEYRHDWRSRTCYTQLRLDPLGRESAEEMIGALLPESAPHARSGRAIDGGLSEIRRFVVDKTQGNPFFMEEMVQALFDQGALTRNGAIKQTKPLGEIKIPATVQGILGSRIDRLAAREKELLQTLAVIGKEFPLGLIRRVAPQPDEELHRVLSTLQLAEFIYEQPAFPDVEYTFKHALTLEVAYASMLTERRKALHERIASAIEEQFADRLGDHFGELARHYSRSGNTAKAVEYLWLAANQATQRSSYSEAIGHTNAALELLRAMPEGRQRAQYELRLQVTLGVSQMAASGFSSDDVERAYSRARDLARDQNEPLLLFAVLNGLWGFHYTRGRVQASLDISSEMMAIADQLGDRGAIREAHTAMGSSLELTGDLAAARHHLEQSLAMADAPRQMGRPGRFGPDPNVLCLTRLCSVLFDLGYPDQAMKRAYEAMSAVDAGSDPFSFAMATIFVAQIHCARREAQQGEETARRVVALCEEHGYPFWLSVGKRILAWALGQQGRTKESIAIIEEDLRQSPGPEGEFGRFQALLNLAEGYAILGERERAFALLEQWSAVRDKTAIKVNDSFFHRLRGRLFDDAGDYASAEEEFRLALHSDIRRNAKAEQLRSALPLARLLKKQGRSDEARRTLAEALRMVHRGLRHFRLEASEVSVGRTRRGTVTLVVILARACRAKNPDLLARRGRGIRDSSRAPDTRAGMTKAASCGDRSYFLTGNSCRTISVMSTVSATIFSTSKRDSISSTSRRSA